jgi:hypothetical protein
LFDDYLNVIDNKCNDLITFTPSSVAKCPSTRMFFPPQKCNFLDEENGIGFLARDLMAPKPKPIQFIPKQVNVANPNSPIFVPSILLSIHPSRSHHHQLPLPLFIHPIFTFPSKLHINHVASSKDTVLI